MTNVTFISADGARHEIDASNGYTLMEIAIWNDVPGIVAECGGNCACATCHVLVAGDWYDRLPPASEAEQELVNALEHRGPTSRLSCQIKIAAALGGLVVEVPETQD